MAQVKGGDMSRYWSIIEEKWRKMAKEYEEEPPSGDEELTPLVLNNGLRIIPDKHEALVEIVDGHKRLVVSLPEQESIKVARKLIETVYSHLWNYYEFLNEQESDTEGEVIKPKMLPEWIDNDRLAVKEMERELKDLERKLVEAYKYREEALTYQVLILKLRQVLDILDVIEYKLR